MQPMSLRTLKREAPELARCLKVAARYLGMPAKNIFIFREGEIFTAIFITTENAPGTSRGCSHPFEINMLAGAGSPSAKTENIHED